jgi:hypothetical protein
MMIEGMSLLRLDGRIVGLLRILRDKARTYGPKVPQGKRTSPNFTEQGVQEPKV